MGHKCSKHDFIEKTETRRTSYSNKDSPYDLQFAEFVCILCKKSNVMCRKCLLGGSSYTQWTKHMGKYEKREAKKWLFKVTNYN